VAPKLEKEFVQYAKRYRSKLEDRRFWQGMTAVVLFYLFAPYLLYWTALRFPAFPETVLRLLNQPDSSDTPLSPSNAGSSKSLP